jgi:hypothetical protein
MNGSSPDEKCDHFITEEGKCISCGQPWDSPKWTMEELQKEWDSNLSINLDDKILPGASNIPAICSLAEQTWQDYRRRAASNEDPQRPQVPRLRLVGGQLMRIPFHYIFKEVLGPSYDCARSLGYLGTYEKWCQFVKESQRPT